MKNFHSPKFYKFISEPAPREKNGNDRFEVCVQWYFKFFDDPSFKLVIDIRVTWKTVQGNVHLG